MVRRLLAPAHHAVDLRLAQTVGGLRREQEMVDTDAVVALPGAALIVPEGETVAGRMTLADGVGPALMEKRAPPGAGFGAKQRIVLPGVGIVAVLRSRNDVVVAGENDRLLEGEKRARMRNQPLPMLASI